MFLYNVLARRASLMALASIPALASAQFVPERAPPPEAPLPRTAHVSRLEFGGGSCGAFFALLAESISEAAAGKTSWNNVNFVLDEGIDAVLLPPLTLRAVTVGDAVEVAMSTRSARGHRVRAKWHSNICFVTGDVPDPRPIRREVRTFHVGQGPRVRTLLTALDATLGVHGDAFDGEKARLRFHEESGLLIVVGNSPQIALVQEVIENYTQRLTGLLRRSGGFQHEHEGHEHEHEHEGHEEREHEEREEREREHEEREHEEREHEEREHEEREHEEREEREHEEREEREHEEREHEEREHEEHEEREHEEREREEREHAEREHEGHEHAEREHEGHDRSRVHPFERAVALMEMQERLKKRGGEFEELRKEHRDLEEKFLKQIQAFQKIIADQRQLIERLRRSEPETP